MHHYFSLHCVTWVRQKLWKYHWSLGPEKFNHYWCVWRENDISACIVNAKIQTPVHKNTWNGNHQTPIQSNNSIWFPSFLQTISESSELSFVNWLSQIDAYSGPGKVQRMDKQSCDASCQATVHWLDEKIVKLILVCLWFDVEKTIEKVFKWEAQSLSRKVSDYIDPVSSP